MAADERPESVAVGGCQTVYVKAIPANVLINQKGEIVARDLRGLTLINRVGELIK